MMSLLVTGFAFGSYVLLAQLTVPVYPGGGPIPPELMNHFVFQDPASRDDLIVSFPEDLASPHFDPKNPGPHKVFKYISRKHVRPETSILLSRDNDNYLYQYSVGNRSGAGQVVTAVRLYALVSAEEILEQPEFWGAVPDPFGNKPAFIDFYAKRDGYGISPGSRLGGFKIRSKRKPGLVTCRFQGLKDGPDVPEHIPEQVISQLAPFGLFESDSIAEQIIGPRYELRTDKRLMVDEFVQGIEGLTKHKKLNPGSLFVNDVLAALRTYLRAAKSAGESPPIVIIQKPAPGLESEIAAALQLSLDAKSSFTPPARPE